MNNDMTYKEMVDLLKALVQNRDSSYATNVIKPIIQMYSVPQVARRHDWRQITKPYNQTMTTGIDTYELPYDFDGFVFLKTKYTHIEIMTEGDFYTDIPDKSDRSSNVINRAFIQEYQGVSVQPSSAEAITITSDNSADGSKVVLVRGQINSVDDYEEITLSAGATPSATTTKSFSEVMYVTKDGVSSGKYTISGATSATTFGAISPEHRTTFYRRLVLDSDPSEALDMVGTYRSKSYRPQRDYDVFRIPADLVMLNALNLLNAERRDADKAILYDRKFETELAQAKFRDAKPSKNLHSRMYLTSTNRAVVNDDHPFF